VEQPSKIPTYSVQGRHGVERPSTAIHPEAVLAHTPLRRTDTAPLFTQTAHP
jgi:hypothetical protein